jgi:hypothetical protein
LAGAGGGGRGCGGLGANGQEGGCAKDERQGGAAEAARREWHRKNANSREQATPAGTDRPPGAPAESKGAREQENRCVWAGRFMRRPRILKKVAAQIANGGTIFYGENPSQSAACAPRLPVALTLQKLRREHDTSWIR